MVKIYSSRKIEDLLPEDSDDTLTLLLASVTFDGNFNEK